MPRRAVDWRHARRMFGASSAAGERARCSPAGDEAAGGTDGPSAWQGGETRGRQDGTGHAVRWRCRSLQRAPRGDTALRDKGFTQEGRGG